MSLSDFARKQWRIALNDGPLASVKQGASEAAMKAAKPYALRKATPIWDVDFDVCLVLDSCRFDLWQAVVGIDGAARYASPNQMPLAANTSSRWSVGSASPEWINNTFATKYADSWRSAGYVTANPFSGKESGDMSLLSDAVYPISERGLGYLDEVWHDQWPMSEAMHTVDPSVLTERALWAWDRRDRHGIDQLVVHYMQPHIPFKQRPEWTDGWDLEGFGSDGGNGKDDWHKLRDGEIPRQAFWDAYAANLEWVLSEVQRFYTETDATILVTSDHGNGMGEWGQWGHPPQSANPALRTVPWCIINGIGDNQIDAKPAGNPPVISRKNASVEGRLSALGYMN